MAKIDSYPTDPAPTADDLVLGVDVETNSTKTIKWGTLASAAANEEINQARKQAMEEVSQAMEALRSDGATEFKL